MNFITNLFNSDRKTNFLLILFSGYCLTLLLFRAKITNSIYLFFLVWNLFLAVIPYAITSYLSISSIVLKSKFVTGILSLIWLLFLPNSFYIITDLVHIVRSSGTLFYLDLIIICSFATVGFILGIHSLVAFNAILKPIIPQKISPLFIPTICILCGFGIYLGRILRYNSWDIISNPLELIVDLTTTALTTKSILFSALFGTFIYISYMFKQNKI